LTYRPSRQSLASAPSESESRPSEFRSDARSTREHRDGSDREIHDAAVQSIEDGDNIVVIASNAGHQVDPQWWLNLKANPEATVQIRRREVKMKAEEATGEERERLWQKAVDQYPGYANYQKTADREIPVVVLKPV
jgi:deazaflavin-dependent oxidoreductase (nitroreductase family)